MKNKFAGALVSMMIVAALTGCDTMMMAEKTNTLSEDSAVQQSALALGRKPSELTLTSRQTVGSNTYVNLMTADKKEFTCIINGGNYFSAGLTNPPSCAKKGDPIQTGFGR